MLLNGIPAERREGDLLTPAALAWMSRNQDGLVPASPFGRLQLSVAPEMSATANP